MTGTRTRNTKVANMMSKPLHHQATSKSSKTTHGHIIYVCSLFTADILQKRPNKTAFIGIIQNTTTNQRARQLLNIANSATRVTRSRDSTD